MAMETMTMAKTTRHEPKPGETRKEDTGAIENKNMKTAKNIRQIALGEN